MWGVALAILSPVAVRHPSSVAVAALAAAVAIGFSPHALPYDTVLLAVPAWFGYVPYRAGAIPTPAPAYLSFPLALGVDLGRPLVSIPPVVLLVAPAWYRRVVWRRGQRPPRVQRAP